MSGRVEAYTVSQRILHWLSALVVVAMLLLGVAMKSLMDEGALRDLAYETHKSLGLVLLGLTALRLAIRMGRPAPAVPPAMPGWRPIAAHATHQALYALLVILPLLGWAGSTLCCGPVKLFGILPMLPPIRFEASQAATDTLFRLHGYAALALACLVVLHVLAALHHHFVVKDDTLVRMLPTREDRDARPRLNLVRNEAPFPKWRPRSALLD